MSHFHCSSCGKMRHDHVDQHHIHFDQHHNHFQQQRNFGHHHHDGPRDFFCDRFLCDRDFRLRLGGLQGGLNFRLRQLIGCTVKMEVEGNRQIHAKVCFVGSDFVEVELRNEQVNEEVVIKKNVKKKKKKKKKKIKGKSWIIPFESIGFIELADEDCMCDCH